MSDVCSGCGQELKPKDNYCVECWVTLIRERDGYLEALDKMNESIEKLEEENLRLQEELCRALR
jgi:predicted amidophosphoribosyltransferase